MITKVRIAPVEQWCEETRTDPIELGGEQNEVGMLVEIITNTMRTTDCGPNAREWQLTDASVDALIAKTGAREVIRPCYICEHMLEMD